jgi:hypothetical protein
MVADGVTGFREIAAMAMAFNKRIVSHHAAPISAPTPNCMRLHPGGIRPGSRFGCLPLPPGRVLV